MSDSAGPEISVVIPIYNGSGSISLVVQRVRATFANQKLQIVLVNDGSSDDSEAICVNLAEQHPDQIVFVQLARNFGEHNAVICGMRHARGQFVAVMDDDAQNPPEEIPRMLNHLKQEKLDVVYGRYLDRKHDWRRRLGSYVNDRAATLMLKKPAWLYLSSFKVMTAFVTQEVIKYNGPFPYIDGLIFRSTSRIGQVDVKHDERAVGESGYTLRKLVRLWLNMFLGFSIAPLRMSIIVGLLTSALSLVGLIAIVIDKLWITPNVTIGIPTVLICIILFSGIQLIVLGTVGEYVGRVFLQVGGQPMFVERYVHSGDE